MLTKLFFVFILIWATPALGQTLLWDANSESDIAGYIVYRGEASQTYTLAVDVGNVTSTPLNLPDPTKRYYLALRAYNTGGLQSALSTEVQTTPTPVPPQPGACTATLFGPTSLPSGAATGGISVMLTDPTCTWTASSSAVWLGLSTTSGTGTQMVPFTALANMVEMARAATVTVQPASGTAATMTITQDAASPGTVCTYQVSEPVTFTRSGGSQMISVTTDGGCAWNVIEGAGWLSASPTSGSGTVLFRLSANRFNGRGTRQTTVTVGGIAVVVRQQGR